MGYAAIAVLVLGGFVLAETFRGTVTKIEDGSITISVRKKGEDATEKTIKTTKDTTYKIRKGRGKDAETEDSDAKKFKAAWEKNKKGTFATIETDDDGKAKSVSYGTGGRKGKGKKKVDD
jgi:hypothetical protein